MKLKSALLFLLWLVPQPIAVGAEQEIIRMSDRQVVGFTQMMADTEKADVVLVGESHDVKRHHELQLEVIRSLWKKKVPLVIGLEMFQMDSQLQLDGWSAGRMDENLFRGIYTHNWSIPWLMYRDIFLFARENHIPMVALNIPRHIVSKVARQGFRSLSASERSELPPEVSCQLNTPYTDFLRKTYSDVVEHMANEKSFTYFCEAQTLRNSGMAWNIARYLKQNPKKKFVVLSGVLHAVKSGIPDQLMQYRHLTYKVILPELPELYQGIATVQDTDYVFDPQ